MVKFRQKRGNGTADQMSLSRDHQFNSRAIGQLDETTFVDGHYCSWTCLHKRLQPRLDSMLRRRFRTNSPTNNPHPASAKASKIRRTNDGGSGLNTSASAAQITPSSATNHRARNAD